MAARNVMQRPQLSGRPFKVPVTAGKDSRVGPDAHARADKEVIGGLVVRFPDDVKDRPAGAALHQRQVKAGGSEKLSPALRELFRIVAFTQKAEL